MKTRLAAVLAVVVVLFACGGSQVHKANRAAKQLADDLHEFEATVEKQCGISAGHCTGTLDDEDSKMLAQLASDAATANDTFVGRVKALPPNTKDKTQVVAWFSDLTASIQKLNNQGVAHIKNPDAKAKFTLIFQSIQTALGTLNDLLQNYKPQVASVYDQVPVQMAGLDEAGIALLLAAFGSITRLIAQARADGSLTDEQLQDATLAEDEDTRKKAADFIKQLGG